MIRNGMKMKYIIFLTTSTVTLIVLLLFGGVCNKRFSDIMTERVVDDYQEMTKGTRKNVETLVSYTDDFAKYMSLDSALADMFINYQNLSEREKILKAPALRRQWNKISIKLISSTSMLSGFGAYCEGKQIYSYLKSDPEHETEIIPVEVLQESEAKEGTLWTDLFALRNRSFQRGNVEYAFSVVKTVQNEQDETVGQLVLFLRESSFNEILGNTKDIQNRQFYLVNDNNQVISASNKKNLYKDIKEVLKLTDGQYTNIIQDGKLLDANKKSVPVLYMSSEIAGTTWRLVGRTTLNELAVQQRDLRVFIQIILGIAIVMSIIVSWRISKRITRPLNELVRVMRNIKEEENTNKYRFSEEVRGEIGLVGHEFNVMMDLLNESKGQIYREQSQRRHNEIRLLQAQIVPHFLYNTLGMITALIQLGKTEEAMSAIQNLVNFYRLSLSAGKENISINEEVELTRNYLALQRRRYIEYVDYDINYDENAGGLLIPKLTIQPLVENVLNHGLRTNGEKCHIIIDISFNEEKTELLISILDDGRGIGEKRLEQIREGLEKNAGVTKSFGIMNIDQRLKLMYGEQYYMKIESTEDVFTRFSLYIPVREWEKGGK